MDNMETHSMVSGQVVTNNDVINIEFEGGKKLIVYWMSI